MAENHDLGIKGEELAFEHCLNLGYELLEKNWRFRKMEIDLIARDKKQIVFIEVKTRANNSLGEPYEFVSQSKQKLIATAAQFYLEKLDFLAEARFDIISITFEPTYHLEHIRDAFYT